MGAVGIVSMLFGLMCGLLGVIFGGLASDADRFANPAITCSLVGGAIFVGGAVLVAGARLSRRAARGCASQATDHGLRATDRGPRATDYEPPFSSPLPIGLQIEAVKE